MMIETIKKQVLYELQNDEVFRHTFIKILLDDEKVKRYIKLEVLK